MESKSRVVRLVINYFFRGLIFVSPIFITVYTIIILISWLDGLIPGLPPGISLLIILSTVTIIGLLSSLFLFNPVMSFIESIFSKAPLAKVIYTSIKDLFNAFGSNKKTFTQPVVVMLFKEAGIQKLGFITKDDLGNIGLPGMAAVYFPHSYNFSGNLYIVPRENITVLNAFHSADALKFIVSGGVTEIRNVKEVKAEL
ncbi:MAG: DUF502 domain-containing protein [Chitinophagales bacterium]|jgi:uncharacterized membrane protein|nr:DUF502 domain-containing protein [Chitinophagales bacterium]